MLCPQELTCISCHWISLPFWALADFSPQQTPAGNGGELESTSRVLTILTPLPVDDGLAAVTWFRHGRPQPLFSNPILQLQASQGSFNHFLSRSLQADSADGAPRFYPGDAASSFLFSFHLLHVSKILLFIMFSPINTAVTLLPSLSCWDSDDTMSQEGELSPCSTSHSGSGRKWIKN